MQYVRARAGTVAVCHAHSQVTRSGNKRVNLCFKAPIRTVKSSNCVCVMRLPWSQRLPVEAGGQQKADN